MLTVGSLFSGIGGLDLGLERAGMKVIWNCEIDPYACRVLKKHWPEIPNLGNIKEINWNDVPRPDVLCGGYPCQPLSYSGSRKGEEDPRHLFPWVAEAIRQLRPRYAVMENVSGHLSLGFGTVQGLLAEIGYDCRWDCVPAAAVGAPHLRDRVFIVATRNDAVDSDCESESDFTKFVETTTSVPNSTRQRGKSGSESEIWFAEKWPAPRRCSEWETEPDVGRVAHGIPQRMDRLRGLGNAVVPQVAEVIGRLVVAHAGT